MAATSGQSDADRVAAYSREHPWAEHSGPSRLSGRLSWDGDDPPAPRWRPQIVLRGVPGTPSAGIYYIVRANEQGEFVFDKIKGGEFMLTDKVSSGIHWRLRVEITEGEDKTLDLTRANAIPARDDFPEAAK